LLLFDDGTWAHGEREAILTAANLARLYRCRIEVIETAQQTIYLPARPATPI
jgi:hypothetical protein